MSLKNSPNVKAVRRQVRELNEVTLAQCQRASLSRIPRNVAVDVLTEPKNKLTRKKRDRVKLALSTVLVRDCAKPRDPAVKVALRLTRLPIQGVIRLLKKSARRAAKLKYILDKLDTGSKFRAPLEAAQTAHLGTYRQAVAEYNVRIS